MEQTAKIIPMPIMDKLRDFVTGLGGGRDRTTTQSFAPFVPLGRDQIESMYRSDWLAKKIVDVVPQDMVRVGRQWQAKPDTITLIETEEQRREVNLWPKIKEALVRSRLSGGSCIFLGIRGQNASEELDPSTVSKGGLAYLNVIDRYSLSYDMIERDPQSPWYGEPVMWRVGNGRGGIVFIHPSRMVKFVHSPIVTMPFSTSLLSAAATDGVWGDPLLQAVHSAVLNAASVQQHVAGLVPDARNDVIYVPNLGDILRNKKDSDELLERFRTARDLKSLFGMLLLEGNGKDEGEKWEDRQVSFSQLPQVIQTFLQIVSGAADIPVTRLLGESPGGQNATGESDFRNYYDHVRALQNLQLRPAMNVIDPLVLASAGVTDEKIFWLWTPLWSLNEKEKAEVLKSKAEAARKLVGTTGETPIVNPVALSDALVNSITEDGSLPGLEGAVAVHGALSVILPREQWVPPAPPDPIELEKAKARNAPEPFGGKKPTPTTDAAPKTLYVRRQLLNTAEFVRWASDQGFRDILPSDELHVTVLYSKTPVDWLKMGSDMWSGSNGKLSVPQGGPRVVERLGPTATILSFASSSLAWRHEEMLRAGASTEYAGDYIAHVTISHVTQDIDLDKIVPFRGELRFGPEIFEEIDPDWKTRVKTS